MQVSILRTQQAIREYMSGHYGIADTTLSHDDNPWKSDPAWKGCFIGVTGFPIESYKLTYQMVANVLDGLWWFLFREGRYMEAIFEVQEDGIGTVGVGKVSKARP